MHVIDNCINYKIIVNVTVYINTFMQNYLCMSWVHAWDIGPTVWDIGPTVWEWNNVDGRYIYMGFTEQAQLEEAELTGLEESHWVPPKEEVDP